MTAAHKLAAQTMANNQNKNLPRPNNQQLSRFKAKLRKIATGADECVSFEEMTCLLPHIGADLVTKAYFANPDRFIASIDISLIRLLPHDALKHMLRERYQVLREACIQVEVDAGSSFQWMEEKRHAGSSTLTAVRLWPIIRHLLDDASEQSRAGFVRVLTDYKVWAAREYSVLGQAEAKLLDRLSSLLEKRDGRRARKLLEELDDRTDHSERHHAGRVALVRLSVYMRRRGQTAERPLQALFDALAKTQPRAANLEMISIASASASLIASHTRNNRRHAQGNPPKPARLRLFRRLAVFWRRHGRGPVRDASGKFATKYIDFLEHLSICLNSEIEDRKISGHDRLRLGNRKAITAALGSLKTKEK